MDPGTAQRLLAHPGHLEELVLGAPGKDVVVDEVQRVPVLLDTVHRLIEAEGRKRRFILTGSSTRRLKRAGVNLLGGRALRLTMHPFTAFEMGAAFDLKRALEQGLLPVVLDAPRPADTLGAYAGLYVREEVQAEGLVRQTGAFARFLEAVALSHATVLNTAALSRECQVERRTVDGYLEVLEDIQLAFRLPIFGRRAKRRLIAHSKLYLTDAGLYRSLRPRGPLDSVPEALGPALEGLVAQHLRAWLAYGRRNLDLHFWHTQEDQEVDFVLYGPEGFYALEVKASTRIQKREMAGLLAFKEDYPEASVALLYTGKQRLQVAGVDVLPVEDFLRTMDPKVKRLI